MRIFLKLVLLCAALLIAHHIAKAQSPTKAYVPGELIVKFKEGNTSAKTNHIAHKMQAKVLKTKHHLGTELWKVETTNSKLNVEQLVEAYKDHPDIDFIELNYLYSLHENEPDTYFDKQWGLHNTHEIEGALVDADIDAEEAWGIQSQSASIMVGILDTGVDWQHPDLIDNIWQNLAEDADGDGSVLEYDSQKGRWVFDKDDIDTIDNDDNGYIDDLIGWNFVDDNNKPFDYEALEDGDFVHSHGTHVAGIIGASGDNGIGISGVSKKVQLVPLKILTDASNSTGTAWDAVDAIDYANSMGIQISNNSWGGTFYSKLVEEAIEAAGKNNHLFIASAGNGGWDKVGDKVRAYFPATYPCDNIISVANTDSTDALNPSSNYSIYNIDVAAPGTNIYSCLPYNTELEEPIAYGYKSGTSMAAPMVAGACALLWEKGKTVFDSVKVAHIKNVILEHSDTIPALKNKVVNSGRLNVHKALSALENEAYTHQYKNCQQRDAEALLNIHQILGLDAIEYDWDIENKPMETWYGVELNSLGCVTKLQLPNSNKQAIPVDIGMLSDLTYLSFSNESTTFPAQYSSPYMTNEGIRESASESYESFIDENNFNNTIPAEIFGLKKLKHLDLENNHIGGTIPEEISQLEQLEYLDFGYNHLTGNLPAELFNLTKLRRLIFSYNQLTGTIPEEIGQLKNLSYLQLLQNELSGTIPATIGNTDLHLVDLGFNNLTGEIPEVSLARGVYHLYFDNNQLTGSLSPVFSWLYSDVDYVTGFDVSHNNFSGCYDPKLIAIASERFDTGSSAGLKSCHVSDGAGNNFDATWDEFIVEKENRDGACWASVTSNVWPGDMNNDGIVNEEDMVFYSVAKGNMGPSRDNPATLNIDESLDTNWEGKLCPNWDYGIYWVDGKHQDANGDGIVDETDYEIIKTNFGKEDPNRRNKGQLAYRYNDVELVLKIDDIEDNNIIFNLSVNRINDGLEANDGASADVHSLAAAIQFKGGVKDAYIEFINSCIGDATYQFDKATKELTFYYEGKTIDIEELACGEVLARVVIIVSEDAIDEEGDFLQFKTESVNSETGNNVNKTRETGGYNSLGLDKDVDFIVQLNTQPERCEAGGSAEATVIGGEGGITYEWRSIDDNQLIETDDSAIQDLTYGAYLLSVSDKTNTQIIPFEIEYKSDYDAEGNLIVCEKYEENYCPVDLKLINEISQATYQVGKNIYADGTITEGKEVELKAGDFIELEPGFIMENNTFLDVKIEGCNSDDIETIE